MEREFLKDISSAVTLNVTGGRIDSFRQQDETTGTVRVYDQGCIGVAGCLGEPDEDALTKKAIEALELQIPYPCNLEGALEQTDLHEEEIIPVPELIPTMQGFLDRLGESCPRFAFTGKIRCARAWPVRWRALRRLRRRRCTIATRCFIAHPTWCCAWRAIRISGKSRTLPGRFCP